MRRRICVAKYIVKNGKTGHVTKYSYNIMKDWSCYKFLASDDSAAFDLAIDFSRLNKIRPEDTLYLDNIAEILYFSMSRGELKFRYVAIDRAKLAKEIESDSIDPHKDIMHEQRRFFERRGNDPGLETRVQNAKFEKFDIFKNRIEI